MKNLFKIIIISTVLSQFVFSKEMLTQKDTPPSFWDRCQLEFGINQFYYNYKEIFNDELFDYIGIDTVIGEIKSNEYGYTIQPQLDLSFTFNPKSKSILNILNLHLGFGRGTHIYDGAMDDSSSGGILKVKPSKGHTRNKFLNIGTYYNIDIPIYNHSIGFLTGIEYKLWNRSDSHYYKWLYFPVGIITNFNYTNNACFGLKFVYSFMVWGELDAYYRKIINSFYLENKYAVLGELPFMFRLRKRTWLKFTPMFAFRNSGRSDIKHFTIDGEEKHACEPESDAFFIGCNISVIFGKN